MAFRSPSPMPANASGRVDHLLQRTSRRDGELLAAQREPANTDQKLGARKTAKDMGRELVAGLVHLDRLAERNQSHAFPGGVQPDGAERLPSSDPGYDVIRRGADQ